MSLFQQQAVLDVEVAASEIDFGACFAGGAGRVERVAAQVEAACEIVGVIYALKHGVAQDMIDHRSQAAEHAHAAAD